MSLSTETLFKNSICFVGLELEPRAYLESAPGRGRRLLDCITSYLQSVLLEAELLSEQCLILTQEEYELHRRQNGAALIALAIAESALGIDLPHVVVET